MAAIVVALTVAILSFILAAKYLLGGIELNARTTCLSSVKSFGIAILAYSADNDEKMPPRDHWLDLMESRTTEQSHCPLVQGAGLSGYALNAAILTSNAPSAATTPMIYDSVNLARNASDLGTSLPVPGRHAGRNSVCFVDGHAKSVPR